MSAGRRSEGKGKRKVRKEKRRRWMDLQVSLEKKWGNIQIGHWPRKQRGGKGERKGGESERDYWGRDKEREREMEQGGGDGGSCDCVHGGVEKKKGKEKKRRKRETQEGVERK